MHQYRSPANLRETHLIPCDLKKFLLMQVQEFCGINSFVEFGEFFYLVVSTFIVVSV